MRVIICGAGRVGQGIARHLAQEHHDITMIDENDDLIEQVQIDFDVRGVVGHAAHPNVLRTAGVTLGSDYPEPIVDHAFARQRALDALQKSKA